MSELIDNRRQRVSVLKEIIQHLHAGAVPELVKDQLREIVLQTDATEIMAMEQELMAEGMPVDTVRSMCDLHSHVTRDLLVQLAPPLHADDRVAFFSEGPSRIFARSRAIIGRKVQHCHPPKSVDTVNRILDDFRAGRENVAEFWMNFQGKLVHVRYFAVRDKQGAYLGTVELTQDITPLKAIEGEKRLLQYN